MSTRTHRILPLGKLQKLLARIRYKKKVVLTNGVFDLLHPGHVSYLERARRLGDILVVAVNGDASVRALKGPGRPLNRAGARAFVLSGLRCVDYVTVFAGKRATGVIRSLKPDIYVKGGDYRPETLDAGEREALEDAGTAIRILPFVAGHSTTGTIRRMKAPARRGKHA